MNRPGPILLLLVLVMMASTGCVRRKIDITSDPSGARVWLNDREVGRTPIEVDFTYYGRYDVRLELAGYQPVWTVGSANAPVWDTIGADLVMETVPTELTSTNQWHYILEPAIDDPDQVLQDALELGRFLRDEEARESGQDDVSPEPADDQDDTPPEVPPSSEGG
ncbi:MAG: hypothetical protein CMJ32_08385 [Phycisphaerae bacterium]|nr:hypothetical protein [Phycisphaerae bacterium]